MQPRDPASFTVTEIEALAERCRYPNRKGLVFGIEGQALVVEALRALARERARMAQEFAQEAPGQAEKDETLSDSA